MAVMLRQSATADASGDVTATLTLAPNEGSILAALVFHRTTITDVAPTISWDAADLQEWLNVDLADNTFRRGLAVATRIAGVLESASFTANWDGAQIRVLLGEFEGDADEVFAFLDSAIDPGGQNVTSVSTGTTGSVTAPVALVTAIGLKKTNQTIEPISWTNGVSTAVHEESGNNARTAQLGLGEDGTSGTKESTASWTADVNGALAAILVYSTAEGGQNLTETVTDDAGSADAVALDQGKTATDDTGLTDQLTAGLVLDRELADDAGPTDAVTASLGITREQADDTGLTDAIDASLFRLLEETVTDDAGPTDSVETSLFRLISETAQDTAGVTDAASVEQAPVITDGAGMADTLALDEGRMVTDAAGVVDSVGLEIEVVLADTAGATDVVLAAPPVSSIAEVRGRHVPVAAIAGRHGPTQVAGRNRPVADVEGAI